MTNRSFFRGFRYAANGLWLCIKTERTFRFHLVFAAYVFGFAPLFSLTRAEWAMLCLTVGAMLCAELFNSAIERTVDRISAEQHPLSGAAKDMAAAAVLVLSVAAVGVGLWLFLKPSVWLRIFADWQTAWWKPCLVAISLIPAWVFVFKRRK